MLPGCATTHATRTHHDTPQEPLVSLIFNPSAVRDGHPCCHAYKAAKDGCDLVVGIANGEGEGVRAGSWAQDAAEALCTACL
jgi:hypothetical protein